MTRMQAAILAVLTLAAVAAVVFLYTPFPAQAKGYSCKAGQVVASWYGTESGNRTANGEHFDGSSMTAAHRTLPFGTKVRVTYKGKSVTVRINDRGPAKWTGATIDLARAAARKIGLGKGCVTMKVL